MQAAYEDLLTEPQRYTGVVIDWGAFGFGGEPSARVDYAFRKAPLQ
jgi:hypothetical protein